MADVGARIDRGIDRAARPAVHWARRRGTSPSALARAGLLLAVAAAVWFSEPGVRGALCGAVLLAAALGADAVAARLRSAPGDALDAWTAAVLARLREYAVLAGVAVGGAAAGVADAWTWAAAALAALALRDGVAAARTARPADAAVDPSPIVAVDPGRPARRDPGDASLTAELLGGPVPIRTSGGGGRHPEWEAGRERALRSVRAARTGARPAPGRVRPARAARARLRRLLSFPQPVRFAAVAATITIWDARVTFVALIAGCAAAVAGALIDPPDQDPAR